MPDKRKTSMWLSKVAQITLRELAHELGILTPSGPGAGVEGTIGGMVEEIANLTAAMGKPAGIPGPTMAELLRPYLDALREARAEADRVNAKEGDA